MLQGLPTHILLLIGFIACAPGRAVADEAAEQLVLATYKLANGSSTATGFAVEAEDDLGKTRRFIVTAHHVLSKMTGDSCTIVDRTAIADGGYKRREIQTPIRNGDNILWSHHSRQDIAVLPLPDSIELHTLPFDCLATESLMQQVHTGDGVRSAVFPERTESNGAGFPLLRTGCIASFPINPIARHPILQIDTTTWTGDSGGPVAHAKLRSPSGAPLIIGVVRSMRNITDTVSESRFVQRRTHYPLGIAEVVTTTLVRGYIEEQLSK